MYRAANLKKLGVSLEHYDYVVALAGNPNTGKSTLFNRLTGLRQHTGNWPGKTVTRAEGGFSYNQQQYKVVDLPGTYSLLSTTLDEEVARNFILFGQPDVTLVVVDATALERNLNLALQVLEITDKVVVCLNLMDEARRKGIQVDERQLARDLGVPVIPMAAQRGEGLPTLLETISDMVAGTIATRPHRLKDEPPAIKEALGKLVAAIEQAVPGLPNTRWVAMRLLEGDERIAEALRKGELGDLRGEQYAEKLEPTLSMEGAA
jgi:ferrous iron transport protein B